MDKPRSNPKPISSPLSTGGAGTVFEVAVNAYLLTLLLVRGVSPIFRNCYVSEVSLQNVLSDN